MMQGLSPHEIGSTIYLPVGFLKAISIVTQVYFSVLMKLVLMPLLNIIQLSAADLLFLSSNGIYVDLLLSQYTGGIEKLSLASFIPNMSVINLTDAHYEAIKSDDSLTDEIIWDIKSLMPLSERNPSLYLTLTEVYNATTHGFLS